MILLYTKLFSLDGGTHEATAFAKHNGEMLPPGTWLISFRIGTERDRLMAVEEMLDHWRRQLEQHGRFGVSLGDPP